MNDVVLLRTERQRLEAQQSAYQTGLSVRLPSTGTVSTGTCNLGGSRVRIPAARAAEYTKRARPDRPRPSEHNLNGASVG